MPIQGVGPRLLEIGRIRMGEKGSKGEPKRLEHWRLTSSHMESLLAASKLYGGQVGEWERGGYELFTETDTIAVLVPPNALTSFMEAWTAGGIQRRCDGVEELTTRSDCICAVEENQICEPATNLRVLLPQLPALGAWRLSTKGWIAAAELQGSIELLAKFTHRGEFPAADLVLDQRTKVVAGQTRRFVVPTLRINYTLAELSASETRSIGSGTIVRVDTNTGEINPLESPSRETPASTSRESSPASTEAGEQSAPIRGRRTGADAGGRVDSSSPASRTSSEGTTAADAASSGTRGTTADPSDSSAPAAGPPSGAATKGEGTPVATSADSSPAGAKRKKKYPLDPKDCLHTVGVDLDLRCIDCGTKMAEASA